jgi:hypothetical protein
MHLTMSTKQLWPATAAETMSLCASLKLGLPNTLHLDHGSRWMVGRMACLTVSLLQPLNNAADAHSLPDGLLQKATNPR